LAHFVPREGYVSGTRSRITISRPILLYLRAAIFVAERSDSHFSGQRCTCISYINVIELTTTKYTHCTNLWLNSTNRACNRPRVAGRAWIFYDPPLWHARC